MSICGREHPGKVCPNIESSQWKKRAALEAKRHLDHVKFLDKKIMTDKKAREAIVMLANALYGTIPEMFIKQLADDLFPSNLKRKGKNK